MRNSISCELPPPPAPVPPQLIASISRNSINSIQSYGGDTHHAFFSFSSQQHLHHNEQIPAHLKHAANSYHIYDEYPRYSLPIRHEKKMRNKLSDNAHAVSAHIHSHSRRSRHSNTRRKSKERYSLKGGAIKKKKDREKTPPPPPPPTLTQQLHTNICMKPRHKLKQHKIDREADKLRDIEIEYEYDTDECNEGSRKSDSKCYHVLPVQLQKQQKIKVKRRTSIKRQKRKSIFVDDRKIRKKYNREKVVTDAYDDNGDNRDILMENMMEIQQEILGHFERMRDGESNKTNPFQREEDIEILSENHQNNNNLKIETDFIQKHQKRKPHKQFLRNDTSLKHERIASFASSMNHHIQHYHEEEDLEIFTNNANEMNMNPNENDDALDLNEDDEEVIDDNIDIEYKLYDDVVNDEDANNNDILLLPISPMRSKIQIRSKKKKVHRKTRSKSMSSIFINKVGSTDKKQIDEDLNANNVKIRRIQSVGHKKHHKQQKHHHNHGRKHRKSSELKYSLTSQAELTYDVEKEELEEDKKERHRKKKKCRKKERRKRDKKEKEKRSKHKKHHKRKKHSHDKHHKRMSKKYESRNHKTHAVHRSGSNTDIDDIFSHSVSVHNGYRANQEAIKHLHIDLNAEFMMPQAPQMRTHDIDTPRCDLTNMLQAKKSRKRRRKRERAKALKLSKKHNSATTHTRIAPRKSMPQLQNHHTEITRASSSKANVVLPLSPDFKVSSRAMLNNRLSSASETQVISYKKYENINYFNFDHAINDTFIPIPPPPVAKKLSSHKIDVI